MAFTLVASLGAENTGSGSTLDLASTMNVATGDVLVCIVGYYGATTTTAVADTGSGNAFTMVTEVATGSDRLVMGYVLSATSNASSTFRATWGAARTYRDLIVFQFRPDSGETVSLDASGAGATGNDANPTSAAFNTTGTDEVVVAGVFVDSSKDFTGAGTWTIGGAAVDGRQKGTASGASYAGGAYKLFAASQSSIASVYTSGGSSTPWCADVLAFSSVAAAGLSIPVAMHHYRKLRS